MDIRERDVKEMANFKKLNESELNPLAKKMGKLLLPKDFGKKRPRYVYEVYWYDNEECDGDPIFKKFPSNKARQLWYKQHKNDPDKFSMYADLDGYNVNENLKESKSLKEGAGAGYEVKGSLANLRDIKILDTKNETNKYGENEITIIATANCDLEDVSASSYYYGRDIVKGGKIPASIELNITYIENELKGESSEQVVKDYNEFEFDCGLGGGWSHSTFTGEIEGDYKDVEKEPYGCYTNSFKIVIDNKNVIEDIDKAVTGEDWIDVYEVRDEDGDLLYDCDNEDEAIEYAKANRGTEVVHTQTRIGLMSDFESEDVLDVYEDEIVWEREYTRQYKYDDVEESLKEDTIKQDGKWVNKGKEGTHGTFKTKKQADAQRKAMFSNGFKESKLTEAPDELGFQTDDELEAEERAEFERRLAQKKADRDSAKQKELDRQEQERKDKEAKEQAKERGKELYDKFKSLKSFDDIFELLVPGSGKADTVAGELWRAIARLEYRFFNDGDKFYEGYGRETAGSSAVYLIDEFGDVFYDYLIDMVGLEDKDYERYIEHLKEIASQYLKDNPELFGTLNEHDSRSSKEYDIDNNDDFEEPREYEYQINLKDYENSDGVCLNDFMQNGDIDSWDFIERLKEDVSAELGSSHSDDFEVERPWSHYDEDYTISNLTKEEYDIVKEHLSRSGYFDSYIDELVQEYGDPNDRDEDVEESLNENKSDYKTLREIISLFKQYAPDDFINEFGNEENALDILKDNLYGDEYLGYNIVDLLNEIIDFGTREEKEKASRLLKVVKLHKGKRG